MEINDLNSDSDERSNEYILNTITNVNYIV